MLLYYGNFVVSRI